MRIRTVEYKDLEGFLAACRASGTTVARFRWGYDHGLERGKFLYVTYTPFSLLTAFSQRPGEIRRCRVTGIDPDKVRDRVMLEGISVAEGEWDEVYVKAVLGTSPRKAGRVPGRRRKKSEKRC